MITKKRGLHNPNRLQNQIQPPSLNRLQIIEKLLTTGRRTVTENRLAAPLRLVQNTIQDGPIRDKAATMNDLKSVTADNTFIAGNEVARHDTTHKKGS